MDFLPPKILKYSKKNTEQESPFLYEINRQTHLQQMNARMLSGHLQGRILSMYSYLISPSHVLEIGTYTGYATLCLAEGLKEGGKVVTIDNNEEISVTAQKNFETSGFKDRIELLVGDADKIIPELPHTWNLVFMDADKKNYKRYYDLVMPNLKSNGLIIADNVLWSGKVTDDEIKDEDAKSLKDFSRYVHQDDRIQNILLPVRDGLMLIRKK